MDLLVVLALTTFIIVIAFALWSKSRTEKKMDKPNAPKSSLARDKPDPNLQPDPEITDPNNVAAKR
ncbi:hypothetical protein [uncultured Marivita sp.]|uniref:hypothetical protein n=1 Tax=uncultured Marivita sp. TaxID=888080 RepID=UPI00263562EF|nr:hypothetical protein [uncultured Marivita sp.]